MFQSKSEQFQINLALKPLVWYSYLALKTKGGYGMPKKSSVSGKRKGMTGNKRSHSLQATRRTWNVNLQKATIMVDGKPKRVRISARELKALKAQQAK